MSRSSVLAAGGHRVLGVAFLVLVIFSVWLTYAVFTKKFVAFVPVTLKTSSIGLQLPALADVKIRGVIVGDVREIESSGEGATLTLAIDPEKADIIPANATAQIVPKTLFGEKYVDLQVPAAPTAEAIAANSVIEESEVALGVEKVQEDLYTGHLAMFHSPRAWSSSRAAACSSSRSACSVACGHQLHADGDGDGAGGPG